MPFGPGLQPGEPPLLNRPTVATGAGSRLRTRGGSGHRMDVRWSRRRDSNPEPAVYKTAALPIELRRRDGQGLTAEDPIRRRGMIWPAGRMGQAWGSCGTSLPVARRARGVRAGRGGRRGTAPPAGSRSSSPARSRRGRLGGLAPGRLGRLRGLDAGAPSVALRGLIALGVPSPALAARLRRCRPGRLRVDVVIGGRLRRARTSATLVTVDLGLSCSAWRLRGLRGLRALCRLRGRRRRGVRSGRRRRRSPGSESSAPGVISGASSARLPVGDRVAASCRSTTDPAGRPPRTAGSTRRPPR